MSPNDKIKLFKEATIKFNNKHNLISKKNTDKIIEEAIEEAIALTEHLKQNKNILDIGTGSGLPGIPLAILNEDKNIYLSEKNNKKNVYVKNLLNIISSYTYTSGFQSNRMIQFLNFFKIFRLDGFIFVKTFKLYYSF